MICPVCLNDDDYGSIAICASPNEIINHFEYFSDHSYIIRLFTEQIICVVGKNKGVHIAKLDLYNQYFLNSEIIYNQSNYVKPKEIMSLLNKIVNIKAFL